MEELTKDCPKAHKIVVKFLCRAAIDEILPPSFFTNAHVEALGGTVLEDAKSALSPLTVCSPGALGTGAAATSRSSRSRSKRS